MESVVSGTNRDGEKCEHNFFSCMRRKVNLEPVILICTVRYRHVGLIIPEINHFSNRST